MAEQNLLGRLRFQDNTARVTNRPAVDSRVAASIGVLTREQAAARLTAASTAYEFVNGVVELGAHPALRRVDVGTPDGVASIIAPSAIRDGAAP